MEARFVAGAAFLATDDRVSATKRASIGWCFGGGWSLKAGIHTNLDATVMYYGHPVMDTAQLQELDGPLLGIFGNEDQSITPKKVDEFDAALDEAGVTHRILRYDANHAFANPSSGRYDHEAATQAWSEVRAFLEAQLVGAAGAE
jgi:carboxymethylenebutenolidase